MNFAGVGEGCCRVLCFEWGRWRGGVEGKKEMFLDFLSCMVPCDSQWADSARRHSLPLQK